MKVILNQDVHNLGEEGDVKNVTPGYARNYLIPQDLAVPHNKMNLALFEHRKAAIEKRKEEKRTAALSLKERLEGLVITIDISSGDTGRLFGSVTNANIVEELQKQGLQIERKRIELPEHALKMVGTYPFKIKLYDNNVAELTLIITSPEMRKKAASDEAAKETVEEPAVVKNEAEEAPVEEAAADEVAAVETGSVEAETEADDESAQDQ